MSSAARVWVSASELVYLGPALGHRPHSTAVPRLLLGVDGPFVLDWGATGPNQSWVAYVPPRVPHAVTTSQVWAVLYLDPGSHRDLFARHADPSFLASLAGAVADGDPQRALTALGPTGRPPSPVNGVIRALTESEARLSAAEAAEMAGFSTSHFLRLFTTATGTSYRRFGMWSRLLAVTRRLPDATLTRAAADAGFASPSHLSDTVRTVFGFTASELLDTGAQVTLLERQGPHSGE